VLAKAAAALGGLRALYSWIERVDVERIDDDGGDALLVRVIAQSGIHDIFDDGVRLFEVRRSVRAALASAGVDLWSYVRVLSADELEAA